MPYVEGFGTYPFGEEWLFDAVVRSYLPVLEVARDLTMTVTPVLADQLEDAGVRERLRRFLVEYRIGSAEADLRDVDDELKPACAAEVERYSRALELLDAAGGDPLAPFQRAAAEGRVALGRLERHPRAAAADGDRRRPAAAARRRDPLAPPPLRLGRRLLAARVRLRAGARVGAGPRGRRVVLRRPERPRGAARGAPPGGDRGRARWRCRSTGRRSPGSGRSTAIPPTRPTRSSTANRCAGCGSGGSAAAAYDPAEAAAAARRQAGEFLAAIAERLRGYAAERGRRGLIVFAIDTELLGHWWSEGPQWLTAVLDGRRRGGRAPGDRPGGARRPRARGAAAAPL